MSKVGTGVDAVIVMKGVRKKRKITTKKGLWLKENSVLPVQKRTLLSKVDKLSK